MLEGSDSGEASAGHLPTRANASSFAHASNAHASSESDLFDGSGANENAREDLLPGQDIQAAKLLTRNVLLLAFVFLFTLGFSVAELIAGLASHSLLLIEESVHMFADSCSFGISLWAETKAGPNADSTRANLIGATISVLTLTVTMILITVESIRRLLGLHHHDVVEVNSTTMLTFGLVLSSFHLFCLALYFGGVSVHDHGHDHGSSHHESGTFVAIFEGGEPDFDADDCASVGNPCTHEGPCGDDCSTALITLRRGSFSSRGPSRAEHAISFSGSDENEEGHIDSRATCHNHGQGRADGHDHEHELSHLCAHGHEHSHDHSHSHGQSHVDNHGHDHGHSHVNNHGHEHGHSHVNNHGHEHGHNHDHGHSHDHGHHHAHGGSSGEGCAHGHSHSFCGIDHTSLNMASAVFHIFIDFMHSFFVVLTALIIRALGPTSSFAGPVDAISSLLVALLIGGGVFMLAQELIARWYAYLGFSQALLKPEDEIHVHRQ